MADEKRRAPVRRHRIELDDDGFPGWWVEVRLNPPWGVMEDLYDTDDFRVVRESLARVILDWNFVDDEGDPLPPPSEDVTSLREVPIDLITVVLQRYQQVATELPKA